MYIIWGSCKVPQDSLDRSPGKRHREGSPYARLTSPHVRSRRASLASISATGTPVAAVPCVLFSFLHIFPTQNLYFFEKSPFFALKRNAKRSFWPQTYNFSMKNQYFWWTIDTFSMGGLVLVFGWSWGGLGVVLGWWRVEEGSMKGSMKGRWRIDEGSMKDRWRDQWRVDEGSMNQIEKANEERKQKTQRSNLI